MWKRLNQLCTEGAKEMIYLRRRQCFVFAFSWLIRSWLPCWLCELCSVLPPLQCFFTLNFERVQCLHVCWMCVQFYQSHDDRRGELPLIPIYPSTVDFFCPPTADSLTLGTVCESTGGVIDDVILLCFPVSYYSMQKSKTSPRWNITIIHQPVLNLLWQIKKSV